MATQIANRNAQPALQIAKPRADSAALVREHMTLVRKIAWSVHRRLSSAIDIDDLVQIGMVALVEAARAYEDRGHAFATYATLRIRGSMVDGLRRQAAQCRSAMAKRRAIASARTRFEGLHGHSPSDRELADAMQLDLATLQSELHATQSMRHDSLDDLYSDQSMVFAAEDDGADVAFDRVRLQVAIADGIRALPQREAIVLQLYFVEELSLEAIGATLGVGAARVCQIKKAALERLRATLGARV